MNNGYHQPHPNPFASSSIYRPPIEPLPAPKIKITLSTTKWLDQNAESDSQMPPRRSASRLASERISNSAIPNQNQDDYTMDQRPTRSKAVDQVVGSKSPEREISPRIRRNVKVLDDEEEEGEDYSQGSDADAAGVSEDELNELKNGNQKGSTRHSRTIKDSTDDEEDDQPRPPRRVAAVSTRGRSTVRPIRYDPESASDDDLEENKPNTTLKRGGTIKSGDDDEEFDAEVAEQEDFDEEGEDGRQTRSRNQRNRRAGRSSNRNQYRRSSRSQKNDEAYDQSNTPSSSSEEEEEEDDDDEDEDGVKKTYTFRQRAKKVNYFLPPVNAFDNPTVGPLDKGKGKGKITKHSGSWLPPNMSADQYAALYPEKSRDPPDSDDDNPILSTPRKAALFRSGAAAAAAGFGGGMFAGAAGAGQEAPGAPNNLGKIDTLADTDPLGVASNITFDSVGGLASHIQQLKEMVALPLLYPEVFERFNITPPRGVLFHGPPGTGKTLLARALASSCSTEGRKISFFMRKGADCLSKWVGEAERQLRLLFDEAKACQPSIIFFDEIDGLAPVRSSKQDQVHASIVSTLLALMDGMDGRGQVIVIGATNRPDAIDPALRRPGRFDREFYFPLPNLEARRKILDIHTSGWEPPIEESFKDELAAITKGYGGADLRALCTEAALNAVQRTYPQIYKTNERLVIAPETIDVTARDFIISQKNLIPSTARATSSSAAPIPTQLVPLLETAFEEAKLALAKVLPDIKKPNVLEEAEWEDDGGGFEKEKMMQAFETLRVFRPRMLVCGDAGMGQAYIGAAILHHLEGFHVQSLDLATLVADSGRSMEAACVQLFVEAKRHKPSILFIPSLLTWVQTVNDTVRMTIKGLLEGLDASDPILLLAVVDGPLTELPGDVRSWFGFGRGNRIMMKSPELNQRKQFFSEVMKGIKRPPNEFPDAMPRKKRILAVLPIAPPPAPKVPTVSEMQLTEVNDKKLLEYLKWRLGPVLIELKKRYKRFLRSLWDDWRITDLKMRQRQEANSEPVIGFGGDNPYYNVDLDTMHMDLYKGLYTTPDDFLEDISFIENNAEVEGDADGIVKSAQMTNHAKVMMDQTFDDSFRADCKKMAHRAAEREKLKRKTGKDKVAAAKVAAETVEGEGVRVLDPIEGDSPLSPLGQAMEGIERETLKRAREDGTLIDDDSNEGPTKRAKGPEEELNGNGNGIAESIPLSNGHSSGGSSVHRLLDPSPPRTAATTSLNDIIGESATSGIFSFDNFTTAVSNKMVASASGSGARLPAEAVIIGIPTAPPKENNSTLANSIPPIATTIDQSTPVLEAEIVEPVPIIVDSPPPEPLPIFTLSSTAFLNLSDFLTVATVDLNIDQLEQLRASCYDSIWTRRKEWNRDELIRELQILAEEFVEEVKECYLL